MDFKLINHVIKGTRFFVHKIDNISYNERLFKIFDKDKPYLLTIYYNETDTVINTNIKRYFARISTEKECILHIDNIKYKKQIINKFLDKINEDIFDNNCKKIASELNKINYEILNERKLKEN